MAAKKFYAYFVPETRERGVTDSWPACERIVKGRYNARYRGFKDEDEAHAWLTAGARYESKPVKKLKPGIYFDAGTGRGKVEISVTDERGKDLLYLAIPKAKLNRFGKCALSPSSTNNYGELLAAKYALELALSRGIKKVFGDSALVLNFWSKGHVTKDVPARTARLAREVAELRARFESAGGALEFVSGEHNSADLGFHR